MIFVYPKDCDDFATNGLGTLTPIKAEAFGQDGHFTEVEIVQPIDSTNRWALLSRGALLKVTVPVREGPLYENIEPITRGQTVTVTREIYTVRVNSRLRLRTGPGTSYKILSSYKNGTKVIKLSQSGSWYQVALVNGGRTGWMASGYLRYEGSKTETITQQQVIGSRAVEHSQSGEQIYRIYKVDADTAKGTVTARAQHVFYDLQYNIVNGTLDIKNAACGAALQSLWNHLMVHGEHTLHTLDGLTTRITGDYTWKNPVECLYDPDEGILTQGRAIAVLDNWDIWVMPDDPRDSGVTIRRGKNLRGVKPTEDDSGVVTRIIPAGKTKSGGRLYITNGTGLNGMCVDSSHINEYPDIRHKFIEYDVKIVDKDPDNESTFTDINRARAKLKSLAEAEYDEKGADLSSYGLTVDFVLLDNSDEAEQYRGLQSVYLNDTVTVIDELIGLRAAVRVTGFTYNILSGQYTKLELGDVESVERMVYSYNLPTGGVSGTKIAPESLSGSALRSMSVDYAKMTAAAIASLSADSITALTAHISEMIAGTIEADELFADLATIATAQITTAHIDNANIDWASISELAADVATIAKAHLTDADIRWANIESLASAVATIADARISDATISTAQIDRLYAGIVDAITANVAVGDFSFATIHKMVADAMVISQATAGTVSIENLLVSSANMLNATVGELVLKGSDDKYYVVNIGSGGDISATEVTVSAAEASAGQTSTGKQIVETDMNVAALNATTLMAQSASIAQIVTTALTASKITAGQALIASATIPTLYTTAINAIGASLDISANQSIRLLAGELDDLTIGGRNLMIGTLDPQTAATERPHIKGQTTSTGGRGTCTIAEHGLRMTTGGAAWAYIYFGSSSNSSESLNGLIPGETYTFSADAAWKVLSSETGLANETTYYMRFVAHVRRQGESSYRELAADVLAEIPQALKGTEMTGHTQLTFMVPSDAVAFFMGLSCSLHSAPHYAAGDYVELSNIKLETGNRATDWTPAPEDVDAAISAADARAQEAESGLSTAISTVDARAQAAEGSLSAAISAADSRAQTAEASLATDIATADARAQSAETSLATDISNVNTRAQAVEEVLQNSIDSYAQDVQQLSLELSRTNGVIEGAVMKDDLRGYVRYGVTTGGDGTLELGQSGSSYVARVSPENGFQVVYDGTPMSSMAKNTISAPVISPGRMLQISDNIIKLSTDGGLIFN